MTIPFPSPTTAVPSREQVFLGYLDFFRAVLVDKVSGLTDGALRESRLPSGWAPIELLKHLTFVEMRWLEWGFEGADVPDPWGDNRDGRWFVGREESLAGLVEELRGRAVRTRAIVEAHELGDVGKPSDRWDGEEPPELERILFHLVQEYARHVGHLDIVRELTDGVTGE